MKISQIIGKQILTPYGDFQGYAAAARLTKGMKGLSCLVGIDGEEEEFYLPAKSIIAVGDVILAGTARTDEPTGSLPPVGKTAYDSSGNRLGTVRDLLFGEEEEPKLIVEEKEYPFAQAIVGNTVILYPSAKEKPVAKKTKPQKTETPSPSEPQKPMKRLTRYDLLGRTVKKTVYDGQGYPLILEGERVSKETILLARKNNRLLQLAVNTLTTV